MAGTGNTLLDYLASRGVNTRQNEVQQEVKQQEVSQTQTNTNSLLQYVEQARQRRAAQPSQPTVQRRTAADYNVAVNPTTMQRAITQNAQANVSPIFTPKGTTQLASGSQLLQTFGKTGEERDTETSAQIAQREQLIKQLKAEGTELNPYDATYTQYKRQGDIDRLQSEINELNKQYVNKPTFLQRVGNTVGGAIKQSVGSTMDAVGLPIEMANAQGRREIQTHVGEEAAQIAAALPDLEAALAAETDPAKKAQMQADVDRLRARLEEDNARLNDTSISYGENLRNKAAEATQSGAADIEEAKKGAGALGRFAVDAGVAGTQMLADAATGSPITSMMVRSFGGATQEAREKGYTTAQQIGLGLASAATEYFSERLFGGNPIYDKDAGAINKLISKISSNENLLKALDSLPADMLSEGLEEVVSGVLNPVAEGVIAGNWEQLNIDELARDAAIGIVLSGIGIGGNKAANAVLNKVQGNTQPETANADTGVLNTPNAQNAQSIIDTLIDVSEGKNGNTAGIKQRFYSAIDKWLGNTTEEERLSDGSRFLVGHTTDKLHKAGVDYYDIYFGKSKIAKIMKNPEMNSRVIKEVADIIADPIVVMDSKTVEGSITMFGESKTDNGKPVMVSMLLHPTTKTGEILDYGIVTSAYGRRLNNTQNLINGSNIRYIDSDKKRTSAWAKALGLQLPSASHSTGIDGADPETIKTGVTADSGITGSSGAPNTQIPQTTPVVKGENGANQTDGLGDIYTDTSVGAAQPRQGPMVDTQSKTLTENNLFSEEARNSIEVKQHEQVSNAMQFARAQGRLMTDSEGNVVYFEEQVEDLLNEPHWLNADRDLAVLLAGEAFKRGDKDTFNKLYNRIQETGTEAAQIMQGSQKWIDSAHPEQAVAFEAEKALGVKKDTAKFNVINEAVEVTKGELLSKIAELEKQLRLDGRGRADAENLIKEIYKALNEGDVDATTDWITKLGDMLAAEVRSKPKNNDQKTAFETILSDLNKFASAYLKKTKPTYTPRTAAERLADYFANKAKYNRAWEYAKEQYKSEQHGADTQFTWLWSDILDGSTLNDNSVITQAIVGAAIDSDISFKNLAVRAQLGDAQALADEIFNRLNAQVNAQGTDAIELHRAVRQWVELNKAENFDTANIDRAIRAEIKDMGTRMSEIIRSGAKDKAELSTKISEALVAEFGISAEGAKAAGDMISQMFNAQVGKAAEKALDSMFSPKQKAAKKSAFEKLTELINLGAFTSDKYSGLAIEKAFGYSDADLTDEQRAALDFVWKEAKQMADYGDDASKWADAIKRIAAQRQLPTKWLNGMIDRQSKKDLKWLKELAYNGLYNVAADYAKPQTTIEKVNKGLSRVKSFQITNQLLRLTTTIANVTSNFLTGGSEVASSNTFARPMDMLMSQFTGVKVKGGVENYVSKQALTMGKDLADKSFLSIWLDTAQGDFDSKYLKTKGASVRQYKMSGKNKLFSTIDAVLSTALNTTDAFASGQQQGAVLQALREQIRSGALTQEQADAIAEQRSADATFHNKTVAGKALNRVSNAFNFDMEYGAGNLLLGNYLNVPAAVVSRMASRTSLGLLNSLVSVAKVCIDGKNGVDVKESPWSGETTTLAQRQSRAAQQFGRAAIATAGTAVYTMLAHEGVIKRFDDDDQDKAAYEAAEGRTGLMINWSALMRLMRGEDTAWRKGDAITALGRLEPFVINMSLGVELADAIKEDGDLSLADIKDANVEALLESITDLSFIQNIGGIVDALRHKQEDESAFTTIAQELISNNVSSLTPGVVQQIAKASDPYYREMYSGETFLDQAVDSYKSTIPGLRQTLPEKVTNLGTPKEYAGTELDRWVNALVNPYTTTPYEQADVTPIIESIYADTGSATVYPDRKAPNDFSVDGEKIELTAEEKAAYQTTYGTTYTEMVAAFADSDMYSQLSAEDRLEVIQDIKSRAGDMAKAEVITERGGEVELKEAEMARRSLESGDYVGYLVYNNAFKDAMKEDASPESVDVFETLMQTYDRLSAETQSVLEDYVDSFNKVQSAIVDADFTLAEYQGAKELHDSIDNVNDFLAALDQDKGIASQLNDKQKQWAKENLTYGQYIPQPADESRYTSLTEKYNLSSEAAQTVAHAIDNIVPEEGHDSALLWQKYDAIANTDLSDKDKLRAAAAYTSTGKAYEKILTAYNNGFSLGDIAKYKRLENKLTKASDRDKYYKGVGLTQSQYTKLKELLG